MKLVIELNINHIWEYPRSPTEQTMIEVRRVLEDIEKSLESYGETRDSKDRLVCKWRIE